ncbi:MAG: lipopolysaccharide biosynthesis protein [Muribaculaceae bacterium]|nr:lipopolysaccharide biosynthesis protein [Muribaculaceae bacterium]
MDGEIKNKAFKGVAWSSLEQFVTQIVQFIIGIVLARLLLPQDYGLVGMLSIFLGISALFINSGFSQALIQQKDKSPEDYNTVFTFNVGVALTMYLILFICAPYIAHFYSQPKLTAITRVYSLNLIISSLASVQSTILSIRLNFEALSKVSIISLIISGITGITLAYLGWGVWALVYQGIVAASINAITLFALCRWIPSFSFSTKSFKNLFSFGSKLLGSSLINTIYENINSFVIGKAFNASELGYYNRAQGFSSIPPGIITSIIIKVNYPILVKYQDDHEKLISTYSSLLRVPLFILYPIMFGLAVLAVPFIVTLVGEKWLPAAYLLPILCFTGLWSPLTHINLNLLYVKGRSDLVLKLEFIKKPIAFALLFASIPLGIKGICGSVALYSFIAFSFNCYYTGKILNYGFWKQIKEILPFFGYSVVMALGVWVVTLPFSNNLVKLAVGIPTGIVTYYAIARIFSDKTLTSLINLIISRLPALQSVLK